jgi:hypothetical protein
MLVMLRSCQDQCVGSRRRILRRQPSHRGAVFDQHKNNALIVGTVDTVGGIACAVGYRGICGRDWNFARSGKLAAIFQKLYRSEDPRTPQKIVTDRRQRELSLDP